MLSTKNLVYSYYNVPNSWVFEYYGKLEEKLEGQDVKIKSLFNTKDKVPSMSIYFDKERDMYMFKDFSSGYSGDAAELVKKLFDIDFKAAQSKITKDYSIYRTNNNYIPEPIKEHGRYKVSSYTERGWTSKDRDFWVPFNIGSNILKEYRVVPFSSYQMTKIENGTSHTITITGQYIYGYFTKDGELYKIYQPKSKERKYIKLFSYLQGSDQLKGHDYLLITSGLKDIMSIRSLGLNLDLVAPDSENTMISLEVIEELKEKYNYKYVLVMLDNDEAGIKAMKKYRDLYGLPIVYFNLAKDGADGLKYHGPKKVIHSLVPLINNSMCEI